MTGGKEEKTVAEFEDADFEDVVHPVSYTTLMAVTIVLGVALIAVLILFFVYYRNTAAEIMAMTETTVGGQQDSKAGDALSTATPSRGATGEPPATETPSTKPVITTPRIDRIEAFSWNKPSSYGEYGPKMMLDGDPETAWNASWRSGGNSWVKVYLKEESEVASVGTIPGYTKTTHPKYGSVFKLNHRLKAVDFVFPSGTKVTHTFEDSPVMQVVRIDPPQSCKEFTIRIQSVYETEKWGDIAISELEIN